MNLSKDDAALLEAALSIEDPYALPNLMPTLPHNWLLAEVEGRYQLKGKQAEKAKCAHPGAHRHWAGLVFRTPEPDSQRFMVGETCGLKKHDVTLRTAINRFKAKEERQYYLGRLINAKALLPAVVAEIEALITGPCLQQFESSQTELRRFVGVFGQKLRDAVQRHGGQVREGTRVRDHAAEAARDGKTEASPVGEQLKRKRAADQPIMKYIEVPIGTLSGQSFIWAEIGPRKLLTAALWEFREHLQTLERDSAALSVRDLSSTSRKIGQNLDVVSKARGMLLDLTRFFVPSNLSLVAQAVKGNVVRGALQRESQSLHPPASFEALPDMPMLMKLRSVINNAPDEKT